MKIVVCVKIINHELNPFDACALEAALDCASGMENTEIIVLSMGKPFTAKVLSGLLRLDIQRVILLTDDAFAGSDTLATSYILSLAVKKLNPDLIICGRQSVDGDTSQVGPCLAQMLGLPQITNVLEIRGINGFNLRDGEISCASRAGEESVKLPALITVERINMLRFPSFRAKTKEVEIWNAESIGADKSKCGLAGSPTRVLKTYESSIGQRKCNFIQPEDLISVIERPRAKKRAGFNLMQSNTRMDQVWAVGEEMKEVALAIADDARVIERQSPEGIAELAKIHHPKVILWNSDLWSKRNAPRVAALLETGLCADCTAFESDGEKLFMYRPAFGGSLTAKIECVTCPQMATVRTVHNMQKEIIVAGGRGAIDDFELLRGFAEKIGAEMGASRGLVDSGLAPYEIQIGLTGKSVRPKLYIACGIHGSVQHTCAIEQSGTIIAINKDKNARIFDYSDYGIIGDIKDVL